MAIVKMDNISLIGLQADKEEIIKDLMKLGVVDITDLEEMAEDEEWSKVVSMDGSEDEVSQLDSQIQRIKSAIEYISQYDTRKKVMFAPKKSVDSSKYMEISEGQENFWNVVDKIERYDELLTRLKSEQNKNENTMASLMPWKDLDIPLDLTATKTTSIILGTIPSSENIHELELLFKEQVPESYFQVVGTDAIQAYVLVIYHNSVEEDSLKLLKNYDFSIMQFKDMKGTAKENIDSIKKRIRDIEKESEATQKEIAALAKSLDDLEILYDHLTIERDRKKILSRIVKTGRIFMLEGWLPEADSSKVADHLARKWDCVVEVRKPEEEEQYPILLKNHPLVQPFEPITEMYSLPNSNELDPTPFLSPFFFVFFGLMVGDAAYGILMMIATGFILVKFKPEGFLNKIMKMLFLGGLSTFVWGALFGGWFGDLVTAVSGGKYEIPPLWFNPLQYPMTLLLWSFIFGAIHLYTGMALQAYKLIRQGKVWDAVFDIGFWYIFLTGLPLLAVGGTVGTIGKYMAIAGAILLVLTQGRSQKNIFKKLFSGILSLYDAVSFFSDVLSYSRLLALGLATGVIASVINAIAVLFGFNVVGILILIIVISIGTVFNVLINALGAYVHGSRLQYVEFFSKFYEGGGKPYQPFKIETKYTNLNDRRTI
jgi:V/A-type H+-transporting ATPase subunit I